MLQFQIWDLPGKQHSRVSGLLESSAKLLSETICVQIVFKSSLAYPTAQFRFSALLLPGETLGLDVVWHHTSRFWFPCLF